jgi:hypothetical protein
MLRRIPAHWERKMQGLKRRDFIALFTGAAAWPSIAAAQTAKRRPVIGTFRQGTPSQNEGLRLRQSFFDGLRELGYIEGRNFDVVIRHAGSTSELPKAAEQLVQLKPDVIFAAASATALAAKKRDRRHCGHRLAPAPIASEAYDPQETCVALNCCCAK